MFNTDYPISTPACLKVFLKPFFSRQEKKDPWIYERLPDSTLFGFPQPMPETMVVYLAGFLTPLFGWRTLLIQEAFPDALYEDTNTHARIRAEFETDSKCFIVHGHSAADCDMIICWEDNLSPQERQDVYTANPNLKILGLKKLFFHYDFDLEVNRNGVRNA